MGIWRSLIGVTVTAAVAGAFLVCGIAAITGVITRESSGAQRRTLLSAQSVVVNATSSLGMLLGGAVLAACGVTTTLVVSGALLIIVAVVAGGMPIRARDRRAVDTTLQDRRERGLA
jgi:predicted MFS family arabinose efflux permease